VLSGLRKMRVVTKEERVMDFVKVRQIHNTVIVIGYCVDY
jgi:hypothetical protein